MSDICRREPVNPTTERLVIAADMLERLAIDMPWSSSQEGLDDECLFCGSFHCKFRGGDYLYLHKNDCVWLEAREFLGKEQPNHVRGSERF